MSAVNYGESCDLIDLLQKLTVRNPPRNLVRSDRLWRFPSG
ncbi:hypothetical protein Osc7112_3951 [Oscillatoria nigro-viridis PCC 7112]|uniref:Uncharacterized protein n=1 Tax=Phormidium nigroviride PCC 7112 TaxID=179408 RepID=K9VJL3_9CYAN|nr:hypothetical protein Osc7112_3951 [Oscillatoria nigro-viridis PCC 7112]